MIPPAGETGNNEMTWNYRVLRSEQLVGEIVDAHFAIHEVYYDDKGQPEKWTQDPCSPGGEFPDDVASDLELMGRALIRPILEVRDGKLREWVTDER